LKRFEEQIFWGSILQTKSSGADKPAMRNNYSGRYFAFVVNVKCLPDPFLVEISRRTKTERKTVEFYKPNVLYCPSEM
jgi:hypothetical protein